jgi:hypothetical protein
VVWFRTRNMNEPLGLQLPTILNELGEQGWEPVSLTSIVPNERPRRSRAFQVPAARTNRRVENA